MSVNQDSSGEDQRPPRFQRLTGCLLLASVPLAILLSPFAFLWLLFWMTDGPWNFQGDGIRYWLFVKGSRLERLGLVEPVGAPPRYSIRLQEGAGVGSSFVEYESKTAPTDILHAYAARCRQMGFRVTDLAPHRQETNALNGNLECEISRDLSVRFWTDPRISDSFTAVKIMVWGDE
jgi:hypothetical protein